MCLHVQLRGIAVFTVDAVMFFSFLSGSSSCTSYDLSVMQKGEIQSRRKNL